MLLNTLCCLLRDRMRGDNGVRRVAPTCSLPVKWEAEKGYSAADHVAADRSAAM